jgi:hypothetical protein
MNTKLILAALMMSLSLAACGQKDEAPAEATEAAPPADTAPAEATPPADAAPMDSTTDETMAPADDAGAAPAEGDVAEPAPAQ